MTWFKRNCCILCVLFFHLGQAEGDGFVYYYVWTLWKKLGLGIIHSST